MLPFELQLLQAANERKWAEERARWHQEEEDFHKSQLALLPQFPKTPILHRAEIMAERILAKWTVD